MQKHAADNTQHSPQLYLLHLGGCVLLEMWVVVVVVVIMIMVMHCVSVIMLPMVIMLIERAQLYGLLHLVGLSL
jgi:hypothetical protein